MLEVGSLLDNKYKILSEVGHGGMSVVYLAINERANKTWAVKEVRKDGTMDFESVRQGLVTETDMLKRLNHPHLPSIIDVIDLDDSFIIVMDFVEGVSLEKVLRESGAQPLNKVIEWGKQLCDVLGYLHSQDPPIIYRDMKPANVMLKPDGNITLIDFGTAREFKNRAMVEDTVCLGTRGYAAPEQFGGRGQTDARTDIYCLGATLYHLITGHSPAEPPYEIKPLRYWLPNMAGSGIEMVIQKCCQQDPAQRYQNCAELLYDLDHVRDYDWKSRRRRRTKLTLFAGSLLVGVLGLFGAIAFGSAKSGAQQETYSYYIQQAESYGSDVVSAETYYRQAMRVSPGNAEAYETLVDYIAMDGVLSSQEQVVLLECINDIGSSGSLANYRYLQTQDEASFDSLWYNIGLMHFFMSDSGWESGMTSSTRYFQEVLESENLTDAQRNLADCCDRIGGYYQKLGRTAYMDTGSEDTYETLWTDLKDIISGDLKEKVGRDIYCIALYKYMGNMVHEKYREFENVGIGTDEMIEQVTAAQTGLQNIRANLTDSQIASGLDTETDEALEIVARALDVLQTYSQTRG